jgi:hypothetical protein
MSTKLLAEKTLLRLKNPLFSVNRDNTSENTTIQSQNAFKNSASN